MILLDTNIISEALKTAGDEKDLAWMDAQKIKTLYLSTISLAELHFGIATADGYIAAIAATNGFAVATRDTSPFDAAGLKVINPWSWEPY